MHAQETWTWQLVQLEAGSEAPPRRDMATLTARACGQGWAGRHGALCALTHNALGTTLLVLIRPATHDSVRRLALCRAVGTEALLLFGGRSEAGRTLGDTWLFDIAK